MNKTVKCGKCGWYHFERSRADVVEEAENFLVYYNGLSDKDKLDYGKEPFTLDKNISSQEKCFRCGASYKDFVDDDDKCPMGVTIQGIINRNE